MNAVDILFIVAAVLFAYDFIANVTGSINERWRAHLVAWFCVVIALLLWHGGR